jgi:hypothetical protein
MRTEDAARILAIARYALDPISSRAELVQAMIEIHDIVSPQDFDQLTQRQKRKRPGTNNMHALNQFVTSVLNDLHVSPPN